jgi:hypothetical protein
MRNNGFHLSVLISVLLLISIQVSAEDNFFAYHAKVNSGEDWEAHSRTARHADLVIQLESGQLIFHRKYSYRPYWKTALGQWLVDEIIPRRGDGPPERPDKNNIYSYVRLIKESDNEIVIHWRYFPDFELGHHAQPIDGNVGFGGVVHEYFYIKPEGSIERVIRKGTEKLDDWNDPRNRTIQLLELRPAGIEHIRTVAASLSRDAGAIVDGAPVIATEPGIEPVAVWHFDEGLRSRPYDSKDFTHEALTGNPCPVDGPKTLWKKGVSGTSLAFDGYTSKVTSPAIALPEFGEDGGFSLEAWVAPGAYSICKWTAIAHQSEWEADVRENIFQMRNWGTMQLGEKLKRGYFLGIDEYGRPVVIMAVDDELVQVTAVEPIPLGEWSHVAFTYADEGMLYLYVNGRLSDFTNFSGHLSRSDKEFVIGKNDDSIGYVSQHVVRTYSTFPSPLGFEGLIDEVKLYADPVWHTPMYESYQTSVPDNRKADMQSRTLPGVVGTSPDFGARYAKLVYHDLWDNLWREADHPDIVVKFDLMPTSVVFWRGNRSPGWVTETNKWISDQSTELTDWHWDNEGEGAQSCCEHMSDYQARHSHVRIIENTDARVVIHWRYASVDVLYKHPNTCRNEDGWGVWTDEYLTIYPDGVGVRSVDQHGDLDYYEGPEGGAIGFHDTQFLSEAGTHPEDNINPQSLSIVSHKEKLTKLDWSDEHPSGEFDAQIIWINLRSDYKVFEIFPPGSKINVWAGGEKISYSRYSAWNHYPVTQAPCDGRFCVAPDRLSHSALGAVDNLVETGGVLLYGFTNQAAASLIPLARSWNNPPVVSKIKGGSSQGYDQHQRAYNLSVDNESIEFTLMASQRSPVYNPCFVIDGFKEKAQVKIDDEELPANELRQDLVRNTDGDPQLVIWLAHVSDKRIKVSITK